jgi:PAS domain S-box-containing protein
VARDPETTGKRRKPLLRAAAEARVAGAAPRDAPAEHAEELLHELQVHQVELEMQNDELRRAQVALEDARDRYVDLYEFSPVGYLTLTETTQIVDANLTAATLLGLERKQLLRQRFTRLVAADDHERWLRLFRGMLGVDGVQNTDLKLTRADGSVLDVRLDCRRIPAGTTGWVVRAALTDITERKHVEQQLRVAAAAFEAQEGMMVTDADNVILRVNVAFTEITGYSAAEAVGQTPRLLRSDRHDAAFFDLMWERIRCHGSWRGEI